MKRKQKISDAEWEVMKVVWKRPSVSGSEIQKILKPRTKWANTTVKTLLSRLVQKGVLTYKTAGKTFYYAPKAAREDIILDESLSFSRKVFDDMTTPMIAFLVKNSNLSSEDIKELKSLLTAEEKKR